MSSNSLTLDKPVAAESPLAVLGTTENMLSDKELASLEAAWAAPALDESEVEADDERWVLFAVFVIVWATALWYAWYCTSKGGSPSIQFKWNGFSVVCNK